MGRLSKYWMLWHRGGKWNSRGQVTQNDFPKKIPAEGARQKCSQNFRMDLPPETLQSDIDRKVFTSDWVLRPEWKVVFVGTNNIRGWEHTFIHRKTGGSYGDAEMIRRRDAWKDMSEEVIQEALASDIAPCFGGGGGFLW